MLERPLIFFDLETTGTDVVKDEIIELYAIKMNVDDTTEEYYSRFNTNVLISDGAYSKHKISKDDLKDLPHFKEKGEEIFNFFKDCDLGGNNIRKFDIPILTEQLWKHNKLFLNTIEANIIDTYAIVSISEPRTLEGLYEYYTGKNMTDSHEAKADVLATKEVFEKQIEKYDLPKNINEISEIYQFKDRGIPLDHIGKIKYDIEKGHEFLTFGKHANVPLSLVPSDYIDWLLKSDFPLLTKVAIKKAYKKHGN